ncbi:hypothetical protein [Kitasatospora sp. MBT66]|uniref:hypothetical protein n=1 Tax=Kitasatospora sp. MBT66 TaxID=1444769 RepID=UPI0005BDCF71|nr:hypothetical protein [Kitasatospora sp. MBT66]
MTETTPAQAQEIEATDTDDSYVAEELDGVELRVRPGSQWRPSFFRALRVLDFDTWAHLALHPDDVQEFIDLDATMGEITAFTERAMTSTTGQSLGKSRARSRSSKTTRKR